MFKEKLDRVIEGLDGIFAVFDDILVIGEGETLEEAEGVHDTRFLELVERLHEKECRLHLDKLCFRMYHMLATSSPEMVYE